MDIASTLAGFGLGLSLIVAIGAQNAFVLRQGVRREHVFWVATICAVSDLILIVIGVSGIGAVLHALPWLIYVIRWLGGLSLIGYGLVSGWRALRAKGNGLVAATDETPSRLWPAIVTCLALTWLNPNVYLDTVFLLGSVANTHGSFGRWWFAAGAGLASILWFFGLGLGSRMLGKVLATKLAWRLVDGAIAILMMALGFSLIIGS